MDTLNCQPVSLWHQRAMHLLLAALCCLILAPLTYAEEFSVPGTSGRDWFPTGLYIAPGTLLQLSAGGLVDFGPSLMSVGPPRIVYGPSGTTQFADVPGYPAETRHRYGLVARLTARNTNPGESDDGLFEQWAYGDTSDHQYCVSQGGYLWLTVNDNNPGDNRGAFSVTLTRGTCRSEAEQARLRVNLYASAEGLSRPRAQFRFGDTIVLRIENNTGNSIHLRQAINPARLIREEGLQVERAVGSRYVPVLPSGRSGPDQVITNNGDGPGTSTSIDSALTWLMELRSTMNITRRWALVAPNAPGSYRLKLVYYDSRNTQTTSRTIYSPTFEVQ